MKILIVSDLLAYGGASKLINDLLPRLKGKGHDCELLILTDDHSKYLDNLAEAGIRCTVMSDNIKGHWKKIKYIREFIKNGKFDVVHANLFPVIYYVAFMKFMCKKCPALVMTEHSTDNKRRHKPYLRPLEQFVYSKYDRIISISSQAEEQLVKWLKRDKTNKFIVVENGIDLGHFVEAQAYKKQQLVSDCKKEDVLVTMVGSFSPQKNHENMIAAMKYLPDNFKLLLVGEGPLQNNIKNLVSALELENRVFFLGFRRDVAEIMHTSDVVCIPSLWEGFGLIAAEAMACGTPVTCSNVTGLSDVVGDCGLKFEPRVPENIATAIISTYTQEEKFERLAKGKDRSKQYDINRLVDDYERIYKEVSKS